MRAVMGSINEGGEWTGGGETRQEEKGGRRNPGPSGRCEVWTTAEETKPRDVQGVTCTQTQSQHLHFHFAFCSSQVPSLPLALSGPPQPPIHSHSAPMLEFTEHLLCARHCSKHFTRITHSILTPLHFTQEKTEAQRGLQVAQGHTVSEWSWDANPGVLTQVHITVTEEMEPSVLPCQEPFVIESLLAYLR